MNTISRLCHRLIPFAILLLLIPTADLLAASKRRHRSSARTAGSRRHSARAKHTRHSRRQAVAEEEEEAAASDEPVNLAEAARPPVPDKIEVIEYGSSPANLSTLPARTPPRAVPDPRRLAGTPPPRRLDVVMEAARIAEIQQALAKKGFFAGEPTNAYDAATVEAMRQFQAANNIDATGYPTARALKLLGLTGW